MDPAEVVVARCRARAALRLRSFLQKAMVRPVNRLTMHGPDCEVLALYIRRRCRLSLGETDESRLDGSNIPLGHPTLT